MSVTGSIIAGVGLAGGIGSAAIGASASGNAASTQAQAANNAALLQQQNANASLAFNEQQLNLAQQNSAPYRAVGQNALLANNDLLGLTPVNPYPINAGGNTAPTAGGLNGASTPGSLANTPNAPPPYKGAPSAPQSPQTSTTPTKPVTSAGNPNMIDLPPEFRAKGGPIVPNRLTRSYIVGEKGPEKLTMFPNGTGWVTPNSELKNTNRLIPRAGGGLIGAAQPVGNGGDPQPASGVPAYGGTPWVGTAGPSAAIQGPASTGGLPANPPGQTSINAPGNHGPGQMPTGPANPYGAQSNNPLITGGSPTPIQNTPYSQWSQQFQAPTIQQAEQYPGYQFQLQQGEQALANQASASGELGDSNYGRALTNYAENAAQSDYNNVYNQALGQYQQNYNIFNNNQANQFNRLSALSGTGQTATNQLNAQGQAAANNASNTLLTSGQQIGQQLNNAGAATASGYIGQANAITGGINNAVNSATMPLYLQYLNSGGGGAAAAQYPVSDSEYF